MAELKSSKWENHIFSGGYFKAILFLAVQDATFYSEDKIDKKYLSTGR